MPYKSSTTDSTQSCTASVAPAATQNAYHGAPKPYDLQVEAYHVLVTHLVNRWLALPFDELTKTEQVCNFAMDLHWQVQSGGFSHWIRNG